MPDNTPGPQLSAAIGWEPELAELRARLALARQMGGAERVARQHDGGRLTVRERIDRMLDAGSFHEIGAIAGKASYAPDARGITGFMPANCVFGRGTVDGRPVVIAGDDFTLRGGSADASIKGKPKMSEQMAAQFRMPIIRLIEGSGGGGSVKTIETTGRANLPGGLIGDHRVRSGRRQPWPGAGGGAGAWLCRRPRRGAAGGEPLLGDGQGPGGGIRGRSAGSRTIGRAPHQAGAGRLAGATRLRCGRPRR